jgi:hypothetical protein
MISNPDIKLIVDAVDGYISNIFKVSALGNPDPDRKRKYFNFAPDSVCSGILRQLNL